MAGTGPEDLQALCQEFLDACVEALDTIPVFAPGLGGAPERSYISPGQSADDCCPDQLTVWSNGLVPSPRSPGNFTGKSGVEGQIIAASLTARIVRCLHQNEGEAPVPADAQADAEQVNADGFALWNHVFNLIRAGMLFTLCGEVFWQGLRSVTSQGGCGGYTLNLLVEIDGYQEAT
jgi:hypothetical protein